jgi:hypothetical protein
MPANQIPIHPEQSVRLTSHNGVLVREDTAFTNKQGVEKRGIRKRAEQALDKLQEPLRKFLEPDEAVLYIAKAQVHPGGLEQMFIGWHAAYLAPSMLVLTNRRLLQLLVARDGTWKRSLRSAHWGDMEEAKVKGWLGAKLYIAYRDGKKEIYWGMVRDDSNKIQVLLDALLPQAMSEASPALAMNSSCPECRAALPQGVYECPNCRLRFKDEKTLLKRALLIPGGGFFYTGHPFLGLLHGFTDLVLIFVVVFWVMVALGIAQTGPTPGARSGALIVVAAFAGVLAYHKWMIIRVSRRLVRNYIPVS